MNPRGALLAIAFVAFGAHAAPPTCDAAALRAAPADLAVLDVDMPRMTGFELTAAIRKDAKLASLPVILLTARGTREDREKGVALGANAYLVKTAFDQSNLLDVIRQYI